MKKGLLKKGIITCMAIVGLSVLAPPAVAHATIALPSTAPSVTPTPTPAKKKVQNGWKKLSKNRKCYYKNGVKVVGAVKIKKKYYFFDKKGILKVAAQQSKSTPYKGIKYKNVRYYVDSKGVIEARKIKNKYYKANGKTKMTSPQAEEFEALLAARKVVAKITNDKMSKSQKRLVCFQWVSSHYYLSHRRLTKRPGWTALFAQDHFKYGNGNCVSDAAAFAYLAKAIGYKNVYVCLDSTGKTAHAWTEIGGRVFDPLFVESGHGGYPQNYNAPYGVYRLRALFKGKVA